jgi:hypothetical protein
MRVYIIKSLGRSMTGILQVEGSFTIPASEPEERPLTSI